MQIFTVSFFGHRQIDNCFEIELLLEKLIRELMLSKEYVEFLVGRDGDFDQLVSSTVLKYKRTVRDDNSSLIWIMPYLIAEYRNNEDFISAVTSATSYTEIIFLDRFFTRDTIANIDKHLEYYKQIAVLAKEAVVKYASMRLVKA